MKLIISEYSHDTVKSSCINCVANVDFALLNLITEFCRGDVCFGETNYFQNVIIMQLSPVAYTVLQIWTLYC